LVGSFFKDIRDEKSFLGLDIKKRTDIGFGGACYSLISGANENKRKNKKKYFFLNKKDISRRPIYGEAYYCID